MQNNNDIDFRFCLICQEETGQTLKDPSKGNEPVITCYTKFLSRISILRNNECPFPPHLHEALTPVVLLHNRAQWHKDCYCNYNAQKIDRALKRKQSETTSEEGTFERYKRKKTDKFQCIFCDGGSEQILHNCSTFGIDEKIKRMAIEMDSKEIQTKLMGGSDVIALETKYHLKCYQYFGNDYRGFKRRENAKEKKEEKLLESRVFEELVSSMMTDVENGKLSFFLYDIYESYVNRLQVFGIDKQVNKTTLKEKILDFFGGDLQEQKVKRKDKKVSLIFNEGMEEILRDSLKDRDASQDSKTLRKAAQIVRSEMFQFQPPTFCGSFNPQCQENSVPPSVKTLMSMLLYGDDFKNTEKDSQETLTLSQLMFSLSKKKYINGVNQRNTRETPLQIYLSSEIHVTGRHKSVIHKFNKLGLGVSYDRQLRLEEQLASAQCNQYARDGVVAPTSLVKRAFTVGAIDNIDYNPSSSTSKDSFHGTGLSVFQFLNDFSEEREPALFPPISKNSLLPDSYAIIPEFVLTASKVEPTSRQLTFEPISTFAANVEQEVKWLNHVETKVKDSNELTETDRLNWSGYHASIQTRSSTHKTRQAMTPLFDQKADTPAMIRHGLDILMATTRFLNPGQVAVMVADCPLYAQGKRIQWAFPEKYGEDKLAMMMGGLHIEKELWDCLGDLLEGIGWTTLLTEADVASSGVCNSFLHASHIMRTREAHTVTLAALHILMNEAFQDSNSELPFNEWRKDMEELSPTFYFWSLVADLEMQSLMFVRSERDHDFDLCVIMLEQLVWIVFALNKQNYARYLPVHIRDLKSLPKSIEEEFRKGNFVINKTGKRFSAIALDQAHEQNNKVVKGSGGIVGLTEDPASLQKWLLAGPEISRLVQGFEDTFLEESNEDSLFHHSEDLSSQKRYKAKTTSFKNVVNQYGNPFKDIHSDLVTLDSRNCLDPLVVQTIRNLKRNGQSQYEDYRTQVLEEQTQSIHTPIKRNTLYLPRTPMKRTKTKDGSKLEIHKSNAELFGKLCMAMQDRNLSLSKLFEHELQKYPPSLANLGKMNPAKSKADIVGCITANHECPELSNIQCKLLDGPVIAHMIKPSGVTSFKEYVDINFIPYLSQQLNSCDRLDVVFDVYKKNSLKFHTRENRGKGTRKKVGAGTKLPGNWPDFLKDDHNKSELFCFIAEQVASHPFPTGKAVYVTQNERVLCIQGEPMGDCSHEESDTRILVHLRHALSNGFTIFEIRTVDSDLIVITVGNFFRLSKESALQDIFVLYGTGKSLQRFSVKTICQQLGEPVAKGLIPFNTISGCDDVSSVTAKGKKTFWKAWKAYPAVTSVFEQIYDNPFKEVDAASFEMLQRFMIIAYSVTSESLKLNEARMDFYCHKKQSFENLPPTENAFYHHVQRSVFRAGIWSTADDPNPTVPSPAEFGWQQVDEHWKPVWISIPEASRNCRELLIKCSCKGNCSHCKCGEFNLQCTQLCQCKCKKSTVK
jgi:hypothetical protein